MLIFNSYRLLFSTEKMFLISFLSPDIVNRKRKEANKGLGNLFGGKFI